MAKKVTRLPSSLLRVQKGEFLQLGGQTHGARAR